MQTQVLVLDGAFQPISRIPWETAMKLYVTDKIEIIRFYKNKVIHSAKKAWKVPAVVKITTGFFVTNMKRIKFSRENVYARDNYVCQYCGFQFEKGTKKKITWDHVIPKAQNGITKWDNVITACFTCNQKKGNKTPEQSGMHPKTSPVRPTDLPLVADWLKGEIPEEWTEVAKWFYSK